MARITQLLIQAEHKPGTLATLCSELAAKAVNITAIMAAHDQPGGIRMVATPLSAVKKVLETMQLAYREEDAIALRITDGPPRGARQGHPQTRRRGYQHPLRLRLDRERRATRPDRARGLRRG
jgi:hypothetical protein